MSDDYQPETGCGLVLLGIGVAILIPIALLLADWLVRRIAEILP